MCAASAAFSPLTARLTLPSRVEFTTDLTLDLLARHGVTATFFVLGWIADRHPRLVERILQAGHEVASHGWTHRRVFELDEESFAEELTRTNATLEEAGAPRPIGFRAPEWVAGGGFLTSHTLDLAGVQMPRVLRLRLVHADSGEPLTFGAVSDGWHQVIVQ